MNPDTVGSLVNDLLSAYGAALEYYTKWQRRKWQANHYRAHSKGRLSGSGSCGLNTSLSISGPRIRKAYTEGASSLGDSFSIGDEICRAALRRNLICLEGHVRTLYNAMMPDGDGVLPLADMIRASEAVRISSLAALAGQQKRTFAVGRPPTALSTPGSSAASSRRHSRLLSISESIRERMPNPTRSSVIKGLNASADEGAGNRSNNHGGETVHRTTEPRRSPYQLSPPSPPLTPKLAPNEPQGSMCEPFSFPLKATRHPVTTTKSTCVSSSRHNAGTVTTTHTPQYPEASVFSTFCPEALGYQKDVKKPMPMPVPGPYSPFPSSKSSGSSSSSSSRSRDWGAGGWSERSRTCRCGYDWYAWLEQEDLNFVLQAPFRLTPRFLGKSHCCGQGSPAAAGRAALYSGAGGGYGRRAEWSGGFGCVLCATANPSPSPASASATVRVYPDINALRDHINHAHTKWQMLHDPDMAGLWGVALLQ